MNRQDTERQTALADLKVAAETAKNTLRQAAYRAQDGGDIDADFLLAVADDIADILAKHATA